MSTLFNVIKEKRAGFTVYRLSGPIDENTNFDQLMGPPEPVMNIVCKEIPRINSVGVKAWIKYFQSATDAGSRLIFSECAVPIVDQINMITTFLAKGTVHSIFVPLACEKCKTEYQECFTVENLRKWNHNLPPMTCKKCGGKILFDDLEDEFYAFLLRK